MSMLNEIVNGVIMNEGPMMVATAEMLRLLSYEFRDRGYAVSDLHEWWANDRPPFAVMAVNRDELGLVRNDHDHCGFPVNHFDDDRKLVADVENPVGYLLIASGYYAECIQEMYSGPFVRDIDVVVDDAVARLQNGEQFNCSAVLARAIAKRLYDTKIVAVEGQTGNYHNGAWGPNYYLCYGCRNAAVVNLRLIPESQNKCTSGLMCRGFGEEVEQVLVSEPVRFEA